MGSQFSLIFDLIAIASVVLMFFAGWRRGLANMVLSLAAMLIAFVAAMIFSTPISEMIYSNYVEEPLNKKVEEAVDNSFSSLTLGGFSAVDFDSVIISGNAANTIVPEYSGRDSAVIDLTNVDLSMVGFTAEDMDFLGRDISYNLRAVNMKTAEFTKADVEKYGLGKLTVAQFIAVSMIEKGDLEEFNKYIGIVEEYIPVKNSLATADTITVSHVRKVVLGMLDSRTTLGDTVMNNFVRPNCIIVIRSIVFVVIYILVVGILKFITSASKLIDKIPVIGDINSFLGGIAGAFEGILMVFIFCLATRLIISLFDGGTLIFNQETIDKTFLFKRIYNFDFLNFLT